jgi:hypothetical protein
MALRLRASALAVIFCSISALHAQEPSLNRISESGRNTTVSRSVAVPSSSARKSKGTKAATSRAAGTITPLGSVKTASPAESFALNGNLAYVCDDNEVSVIDITNPANPVISGTALASLIQNSGLIFCAVQRNTLTVFADQASSVFGNSPGFVAFSLINPTQPQLIKATAIDKRYFEPPVYIGNMAFVSTSALTFNGSGGPWVGQYGDLLAVDLTDFNQPSVRGTLAQPQIDAVYGGGTVVLGATQADAAILYVGGSTSTLAANGGVARLQVVDVSNPTAMKVIGQELIPGAVLMTAPLIQGTVAVGVGNDGGYVGTQNANPNMKGNVVVTTFDVSDRRAPVTLSITKTAYQVGAGGGATRIGNFLFAFAGVVDASNNPVLLIVDVSNPSAPVIQTMPIPQPFTSMQAVGATLYATLGSGGFATYTIPGIGTGPATVCPVSADVMLVLDKGMSMPPQTFLDAKAALRSFINSLRQPADQDGVVSFTNFANLGL